MSAEADPREPPEGAYDYYFSSERPAFVDRLIARKHRRMAELATADQRVERILELGPGEGWFARACRDAGMTYLAVEVSPVGAANMRAQGFDVVEARVPPLPADVAPVDMVYAAHLVEHLRDAAEVLAFVQGARQLLRPGGALALAFPDASRIGVDFWDCDYTHQWPSTPRRIRQVAKDAGFTVRATHRCCLHLTGWRAWALSAAMRLLPTRALGAVDRSREDFWYRGRMLFAPDVLMVLEPR